MALRKQDFNTLAVAAAISVRRTVDNHVDADLRWALGYQYALAPIHNRVQLGLRTLVKRHMEEQFDGDGIES